MIDPAPTPEEHLAAASSRRTFARLPIAQRSAVIASRAGPRLAKPPPQGRVSSEPAQLFRKSTIAVAISSAWVSSAKCPVSRKRTSALGRSRL